MEGGSAGHRLGWHGLGWHGALCFWRHTVRGVEERPIFQAPVLSPSGQRHRTNVATGL